VPVVEAIRYHWREILLSAGLRFSEQLPFYLFTTFVLIYVVSRHGFSRTFVLTAVLVGALVLAAVISIGCVAALPDRSRVDIDDATVYRGA
jgi:hypothetical protein